MNGPQVVMLLWKNFLAPPKRLEVAMAFGGMCRCTYGGLYRYKWFTISFQGSLLSGEYQADGREVHTLDWHYIFTIKFNA